LICGICTASGPYPESVQRGDVNRRLIRTMGEIMQTSDSVARTSDTALPAGFAAMISRLASRTPAQVRADEREGRRSRWNFLCDVFADRTLWPVFVERAGRYEIARPISGRPLWRPRPVARPRVVIRARPRGVRSRAVRTGGSTAKSSSASDDGGEPEPPGDDPGGASKYVVTHLRAGGVA